MSENAKRQGSEIPIQEQVRRARIAAHIREGRSPEDAELAVRLEDMAQRLSPMMEHYGFDEKPGPNADERYGEKTRQLGRQVDSARAYIDGLGEFAGTEQDYQGLDSLRRMFMGRDYNRGRK